MHLTSIEEAMLSGEQGLAVKKSMEILVTLGEIYGASSLVRVSSVQVAGVSYDNLGEAGLEYLGDLADAGGKVRVLTTLNPAGMDIENWESLGISSQFAKKQEQVLHAFARMQVIMTATCTPYLVGNVPRFGEHIAWAESSAVCYANSIIGARTNREGGPSALASALTGLTPDYGYHQDQNRIPALHIKVDADLSTTSDFGLLGKIIGEIISRDQQKVVPYISGIRGASIEHLKSFCASIATFGGAALFHIDGITPEASSMPIPSDFEEISQMDIESIRRDFYNNDEKDTDFVSLGCPHLSIKEIARIAELLDGKKVTKEFWITTARPTKNIADTMGFTQIIENAGAKFAADTCCVVAPIRGRFKTLVTDSAKACYYGSSRNNFNVILKPFDEVVMESLKLNISDH